jgi:vacuolar-type H+-ATPase subunit I/STV1
METKQSGKFITILLGALLAVAVAYTFYANSEHNQIQAALETEKAELKTQLDELIVNYDAKIAENTALTTKLEAARADIISYKDSLAKEKKTSYRKIRWYRSRVNALKAKNKELFAQVDSLTKLNVELNGVIVEANGTIAAQASQNAQLTSENEVLAGKVAIGEILSIDDLVTEGVKKSSKGALKATNRYKKVDAFRAEFNINKNDLTPSGAKKVYVTIKDAEGNVVAAKGSVDVNGAAVSYSGATEVNYENAETAVTVLTDVDSKSLSEGTYTVSVILDGRAVGNTTVVLKNTFLGIF